MKKFAAILMVVMMLLAMTACGNVTPVENDSQTENSTVAENTTEDTATTNNSTSSTETSTTKPTESSTENSTVESTTKKTETTTVESTTKTKETTTSKNTTTKHTHTWKEVYKTVHHDAEYKTVHHDAQYKEEKTLKSYKVSHFSSKFRDGKTFDPYDYNYDFNAYNAAVDAYQIKLMTENTIDSAYSCPAVTHTISVEVYNRIKTQLDLYTAEPQYNTVKTLVKDAYDETVVDKAAYDEKVVDHYECDCGATK